jgi:hypothetical protein
MCRLGTRQPRDTYPTESVAQSFDGRLTADLWLYSFCYESGTQPFEGFIRPQKKLFFCWFPATGILFVRASSRITLDDLQLGVCVCEILDAGLGNEWVRSQYCRSDMVTLAPVETI